MSSYQSKSLFYIKCCGVLITFYNIALIKRGLRLADAHDPFVRELHAHVSSFFAIFCWQIFICCKFYVVKRGKKREILLDRKKLWVAQEETIMRKASYRTLSSIC